MGDAAEHMTNAIRILGLDPGLRRTGWGVVAVEGSRLSPHRPRRDRARRRPWPWPSRLLILFEAVGAIIAAARAA